MIGGQFHKTLLFRIMEYIENTKVGICLNSIQKPANEWSRLQDQKA